MRILRVPDAQFDGNGYLITDKPRSCDPIMNKEQTDSLIRSVLKIAGTALAAHGLTVSASIVNSEDVFGVIVLLVGVWQSHQHHGAAAAVKTATANLKGIIEQFAAGPAPAEPAQVSQDGTGPAPAPAAPVAHEVTSAGFAPRAMPEVNAIAGAPSNPPIQQSTHPVLPTP
jgi:hypothetical protein